jgi:DisA bacterial checkpoint controller nucleotide-binding
VSDSEVSAGRIQRLRHELQDEQIWVPDEPGLADLLFAELDYARHPHAHEGAAPRYGALVASRRQATRTVEPVSFIEVGTVPLEVLRRLADGRSSFVVRAVGSDDRLMCFDRTREFESSAVHLATATGGFVVQRLGQGWVRLTTPNGITTWDGIRWAKKPLSVRIAERIAPMLPGADADVLANLVEFTTHWLGAGRIGAAIVWRLDGDAGELGGLGFGSAVQIPPLDLADRTHFAPLLNALSQYDRAALVDGNGCVTTVGVHLRTSERSRRDIGPFRGTRHTSAVRFTADVPNAVVFVVSSSGALTVAWRGRRLDTG